MLDAAPVLVPLESVVPLTSLLVPVALAKHKLAQVCFCRHNRSVHGGVCMLAVQVGATTSG